VLSGIFVVGLWLMRKPVRPSGAYLVGLVAFTGFVAWTGASLTWSVGPDLTWIAFDYAALYLLVAAIGGVLPGGRIQLRLAGYGFALVVTGIASVALLAKLFPGHDAIARLSGPIGYWNVLAAMIAMAIPFGLEGASRVGLPMWLRGVAASCLMLLLVTFFFTFSRGGFLALGVALAVYFALSTRRLSGVVSLIIPGALVAGILLHLRHLSSLYSDTTNDALRTAQGHTLAAWVVAALVAAFTAQALVAIAQNRWPLSARLRRTTGIAVVAFLLVLPLTLGTLYFPQHGGLGGWLSAHFQAALSGSGPSNGAERLTALGSNGRLPWFRQAVQGFEAHPVAGSGAGTFRFAHLLYRHDTGIVMHSHSEWLNVMSELGLVGITLFVMAIGGLVVAAFRRMLKDRSDKERSLLAACQAAVLAFVVHMSVDWDWDMAAITMAFLLLAGVAAAYARNRGLDAHVKESIGDAGRGRAPTSPTPSRRLSLGVRVLVTGLVVFGALSWALPYVADRAAAAAVDQASRGQFSQAAASARLSSRLNPLSIDPLLTLAAVQVQQHQPAAAWSSLQKAARIQPRNYVPYYQLGLLELDAFGRKKEARQWFARALELNPMDPLIRQQLRSL
jgi:hypothetical protein